MVWWRREGPGQGSNRCSSGFWGSTGSCRQRGGEGRKLLDSGSLGTPLPSGQTGARVISQAPDNGGTWLCRQTLLSAVPWCLQLCAQRLWSSLRHWLSAGTVVFPRGHMATSGIILACDTEGKEPPVSSGQRLRPWFCGPHMIASLACKPGSWLKVQGVSVGKFSSGVFGKSSPAFGDLERDHLHT